MKCNALGPGFCPSRQGRVLKGSELKGKGIPEEEFCLHLRGNVCIFNTKGKLKNAENQNEH
jgi:hypothetical protein